MAEDYVKANWRIPEWFGSELNEKELKDLRMFHVELLSFSEKMNLVSLTSLPDLDQLHFADSIQASKIILKDFKGKSLVDIGAGNGFPGVVLAILDRTVKITFVETRGKRVEFLKHVCARIGLQNVEVYHSRVEDLEEGSITGGVSRAFATLPNALLNTRKVFADGADYYHMKSDGWASEVASIPHQLCSIWNIEHIGDYSVKDASIERAVIKATKLG